MSVLNIAFIICLFCGNKEIKWIKLKIMHVKCGYKILAALLGRPSLTLNKKDFLKNVLKDINIKRCLLLSLN